MAVTSIRNETPSRLTLTSIAGTQIVLAPLQEKEIAAESEFDFDDLEREGILTQRSEAPSKLGENIATTVLGGGFWLVMLGIWLANAEPRFGISPAVWPYAIWGTAFVVLLAVVAGFIIKGTNSFALVTRWTMQAVALTVILAIGLGLPAATIYYFGGGAELLAGAGDAAVVAPAAEAPPPKETALPPGAAPPARPRGPRLPARRGPARPSVPRVLRFSAG